MDDDTSERPRCEVCGDIIKRSNAYGICSRTPACTAARRRKKAGIKPSHRPCEICGRPIRGDNKLGVCERRDSPECLKERTRRMRAQGKTPAQRCEICGRRLRRDNSLGVCSDPARPNCAREREKRRRAGLTAPRGWTAAPYIAAGAVFGRLTVLTDVPRSRGPALVRCECGTEKTLKYAIQLAVGNVRSCGCLRREMHTKHGLFKHPLYRTWTGIINRCTNPDAEAYPNYGGRGITVSERWLDVRNFIEDIEREIGPRPEEVTANGWPIYSLDRIDNDRGYESGNVRWSTQKEQVANIRTVAGMSARNDALTAQIGDLTAQLEALKAQRKTPRTKLKTPRKRKTPTAPQDATLF